MPVDYNNETPPPWIKSATTYPAPPEGTFAALGEEARRLTDPLFVFICETCGWFKWGLLPEDEELVENVHRAGERCSSRNEFRPMTKQEMADWGRRR